MPYLDEDILYNNVEEKYKVAKGKARNAYSDVLDTICEMPRADVVPKSEVERLQEQVSDLQEELYCEIETNKNLGAEYIALRKEKNALNIEIEALKIANEKMHSAIEETKAEVAREIFEEIYEDCFDQFGYINYEALAELKKKYTEGE
jgi:chaperonin cofactor prefoldin